MIKNNLLLIVAIVCFCIQTNAQTQGTPESGYSRCLIYSGTGADQTFTTPATAVYYIKLWGAGGGGNNWNPASYTQKGGGGGFAKGTLSLVKNKTLTFIVGKGGIHADGNWTPSSASGSAPYGGGGAGGTSMGYGASGGGRSAVRYDVNGNSVMDLPGDEVVTAGGGGGASSGTNSQSQQGGPGGGTTATAGTNTGTAAANNGGGGTAAAGGAAGTGGTANGVAGSQFTGGRGGNLAVSGTNDGGGGGGGGWYGGGGGTSKSGPGDAPGGGGSSHYAAPISSGSTTAASLSTAGNTADAHWASGVGRGGDATTNDGGDGRIVIQWNEDHGDAPTSYGDAGHGIPTTPTIYIGANAPDGDTYANVTTFNGQTTATGDESTSSADEDGVSGSINIPRSATSFSQTVSVRNTSGSNATLSGWIDFDKNGAFAAGEIAQATITNGTTSTTLTWNSIPAPLVVGTSYLRLRISSSSTDVATASGTAIDGEIEDFPVIFSSPLPVELTGFSATPVNCEMQVTWGTASEVNSNRTELEHSTNGQEFELIRTYLSKETSTFKKEYFFTDIHAVEGANYYRLKMIDLNGTIKYSSVVMAENNCKTIEPTTLYPNPFEDKITLKLSESVTNASKLIITDLQDKIILKQLVSARLEANEKIIINTISLNKGVYYLRFVDVSGNTINNILKIVKK